MKTKTPVISLLVEIDQSRYLNDEDYDGLDLNDLLTRDTLGRLLDEGYYRVTIRLDKPVRTELEKDV